LGQIVTYRVMTDGKENTPPLLSTPE
jgi:hypothetical protein